MAVAFVMFYPSLVVEVVSPRLAMVALGLVVITVEQHRRRSARFNPVAFVSLAGIYVAAAFRVSAWASAHYGDPLVATNMTRLLILVPVYLGVGVCVFRSEDRQRYVRALLVVAFATAIFAVMESATDASLLGRAADFSRFQREGGARALVGSEHVLVLGTMLASLVPLVRAAALRGEVFWCALLVAGTVATGSRGPAVIALAVAAAQIFPRAVVTIQRRHRLLRTAVIGIALAVVVASFLVWVPQARGFTGAAYSLAYRAGIYALMPDILRVAPHGVGLGTIPSGVWLLPSDIFGVRDLADTIDSEMLYLAVTFGWFGIFVFFTTLVVAVGAVRYSYPAGMFALVVTICGLFVALHAWDSLGPLWYASLGAAGAATIAGRRGASVGSDVRGLSARPRVSGRVNRVR